MIPSIDLNDGHKIPQFGFGVFQIPAPETARAVSQALEVGYRHIDTAEMYGNQQRVSEAMRASGVPRGDVYVTGRAEQSGSIGPMTLDRHSTGRSVGCGFEYIDLFLIHWPFPGLYDGDFVSTSRTLEELQT